MPHHLALFVALSIKSEVINKQLLALLKMPAIFFLSIEMILNCMLKLHFLMSHFINVIILGQLSFLPHNTYFSIIHSHYICFSMLRGLFLVIESYLLFSFSILKKKSLLIQLFIFCILDILVLF